MILPVASVVEENPTCVPVSVWGVHIARVNVTMAQGRAAMTPESVLVFTKCPDNPRKCPYTPIQCPHDPDSVPMTPGQCPDDPGQCPYITRVCPDGPSMCPDGSRMCTDGPRVCPDGHRVCPDKYHPTKVLITSISCVSTVY